VHCVVLEEYVPTSHAVHAVVPTILFQMNPIGQSSHERLSGVANFPGVHSVHVLRPSVDETKPSAQSVHVVDPGGENRPAGHRPHGGVPDSDQSAPEHSHAPGAAVPALSV
jgi:hypothetical protein